jgi:hypothetical protein
VSPQVQGNDSRNDVIRAGHDSGRRIRPNSRAQPPPSMMAASSRSRGIAAKNCRNRNTSYGEAPSPHSTRGQYTLTTPIRALPAPIGPGTGAA